MHKMLEQVLTSLFIAPVQNAPMFASSYAWALRLSEMHYITQYDADTQTMLSIERASNMAKAISDWNLDNAN
jgi:hypothetical protein